MVAVGRVHRKGNCAMSDEIPTLIADISGDASGPGDVPHLPRFEGDAQRFAAWLNSFETAAKKKGGADSDKVLLCVQALRKLDETSKEDVARAGYLLAMWHFQTVRQAFIDQERSRQGRPVETLYRRLCVAIARGDSGPIAGKEMLAVLDGHTMPPSREQPTVKDARLNAFIHEQRRRRAPDVLGITVTKDSDGAFRLNGERYTRRSISQQVTRLNK